MMPRPMVVATLRWNTNTAAKLKNAAITTAWWGFNTRVDTIVAMAFAASWNPFMKSNASATSTSTITTARLIWTGSIVGRVLRMLQHDAFDDIRDVLAAVGNQLEQFVNRAQLDQLLDVGLLAEQPRHGGAHHPVGIGLQAVDFLAGLEDRLRVAQVREQANRRLHALARHLADLRQLLRLRAGAPDVVEHDRLGGVLDQIQDVVHVGDELVDLIAVNGCNERFVQERDGLVRDLVGGVLGGVDALGVDRGSLKVGEELHERAAALDDLRGVGIEQVEESPFARHQSAEHGGVSAQFRGRSGYFARSPGTSGVGFCARKRPGRARPGMMVETKGIEPSTFALRTRRSPS